MSHIKKIKCNYDNHCKSNSADSKYGILDFFASLFNSLKLLIIHGSILLVAFCVLAYITFGITIKPDVQMLHIFVKTFKQVIASIGIGSVISIFFVGIFSRVDSKVIVGFISGDCSRIVNFIRCLSAGLLLHTCNHGIILVAMQFYKKGVSLGMVIAFLLATPWTSIYVAIIFISMAGIKLFIIVMLASMLLAITSAIIIEFLENNRIIKPNPNSVKNANSISSGQLIKFVISSNKGILSFKGIVDTFKLGFKESISILKWILISIVISSIIMGIMDSNIEAANVIFNSTISGILNTLVFASLIEMCSEGIAPMVSLMAVKTGIYGNAFLMLVAGIASDYTEISSLKAATGYWRNAFAFPLVVIPQAIIITIIINAFLN